MGNGLCRRKEVWRHEFSNSKYERTRRKIHADKNKTYRDGYPEKTDNVELNENYLFYKNEIPSRPDGDYIENILTNWLGDYTKLEDHHGYIQWIFPIRERGFNVDSQALQLHEAQSIRNDEVAKQRVLKAYEMMLDFYGAQLMSNKVGTVRKADNWPERKEILKQKPHNFLRITRILKSLGELGWEHLKMGFVNFLFEEVMVNRTLLTAIESLHDYWIESLRDDTQRRIMFTRFHKLVKVYPELYDWKIAHSSKT